MSKARSDRGKTPAQTLPPQNVIVNEVIPGRLTEQDWGFMVDDESTDDFIEDILKDIVDLALDTIFNKILESRLIPYAVDSARALLLELVEWQFLERDDGELHQETVPNWTAEEEPKPGIIDSWAQGAVAVIGEKEEAGKRTDIDTVVLEEDNEEETNSVLDDIDQDKISDDSALDDRETISTEKDNDSENYDEDGSKFPAVADESEPEPLNTQNRNTLDQSIKTRKPVAKYRGKVPEFRQITLTPVTDDRAMKNMNTARNAKYNPLDEIGKQTGRPPGLKEVTFDEKGNVVMVQKLKVEKLPSHRVKTHYTIIDPIEEDTKAKLSNKKKRYNLIKHSNGMKAEKQSVKSMDGNKSHKSVSKTGIQTTALPTPLVDLMNVSKGVSVKEGGIRGQARDSRNQSKHESPVRRLQPMPSQAYSLALDPRDLISQRSPVVKEVDIKRSPLPAIAPGNETASPV